MINHTMRIKLKVHLLPPDYKNLIEEGYTMLFELPIQQCTERAAQHVTPSKETSQGTQLKMITLMLLSWMIYIELYSTIQSRTKVSD